MNDDSQVEGTEVEEQPAQIGHNSKGAKIQAAAKELTLGEQNATKRLRSIIDRVERLEEERKALGSDIRDIMAEAKSAGFSTKVLRMLIKIRKQEPADVEEDEILLDTYRRALGC